MNEIIKGSSRIDLGKNLSLIALSTPYPKQFYFLQSAKQIGDQVIDGLDYDE